jgi:hypothetical protein
VQAAQDEKEPEVLKTCKTPPPAAGQRGRGQPPAPQAGPREYKVTEIPGVIASGQQWKEIWRVRIQLSCVRFKRCEPLVNFRLLPASLLQHPQLQNERCELLAEMVVQIASYAAALLFLCEDNS